MMVVCGLFLVSMGLLFVKVPVGPALIPIALAWVLGLVASVAAGVRRLHDVGRHARGEFFRGCVALFLVVGPAVAAFFMSGVPDWASTALLTASGAIFVILVLSSLFRGVPEWKTGDEGPNEFGPPPLR